MKLEGHCTIITGGNQGFGKAIAREFLHEGASVLVCARDAKMLEEACTELSQFTAGPATVVAQPCDVSSESEFAAIVSIALRSFGRLDSLVCNAGVYGPMGPTEEVDLKEWIRALEINLVGTLVPCRAVIPHFKNSGGGKIIAISGGGATNPLPNLSAYAASKAALVRFVETLAEELRDWSIDVNAVAPGALKTRLVEQVLAAGPEKVGQAFYLKNKTWFENGATPMELGARLCAHLASPETNGITGKLISAQWDGWEQLASRREELDRSDVYCLRRIVPADRGKPWT